MIGRSRRLGGWVLLGCGVLLAAALVALVTGPADLPAGDVVRSLADRLPGVHVRSGLSDTQATILWEIRVPRIVLGMLVGATLALSGAAYQGVFRNPLADPYLLGAAAGAGLGATLAIVYGPREISGPVGILPLAAFVGALAGVAGAYGLGASVAGRSPGTLILAGVAMASFLTAVQTYVQERNADTLREVYSWILGRLSTGGWREVAIIAPYALVSGVVIVLHGRLLDVLRVGDDEAQALGVPVGRVRLTIVAAASLATAAAVAVSGLIAFVGIIVPHAIRLTVGASYRLVLVLSAIFGAAFLVTADLAARSIASPAEVPIGVVTAFVGAPFFAVVLRTSRRSIA